MNAPADFSNYLCCIEEVLYSKEILEECFGKAIIVELLETGILVSQNDSYKFKFVGVAALHNKTIAVIPKVFWTQTFVKSENDHRLVMDLIKSLKIYKECSSQLHQDIDYFSAEPEADCCSEIAVADYILNDYHSNGLYTLHRSEICRNGIGNINWNKTIEMTEPIFSSSLPIYYETMNEINEEDSNHILIEIHRWSIGYCLKYLPLLGEDTPILDFYPKENISDIGESVRLINLLNLKISESFTDRSIRLLKALKYLIIRQTDSCENQLQLFGTRQFEYVWEDICRKLCGCRREQFFEENKRILIKPNWKLFDCISSQSKMNLRPDIVVDDIPNQFYILDAKYYNLKIDFRNMSFTGEPESASVLKQFFYEQYLSVSAAGKETVNGFLLPFSEENFEKMEKMPGAISYGSNMLRIGHIEFDFYPGKKILLIAISLKKAMKQYIANEKAVLEIHSNPV